MPRHVKPAVPESVAFVSLGCPKNLVDSEKMLGLLAEDGLALTSDPADADAIVINTCGFLEASKEESLAVIREAVAAKEKARKKGRIKRIIVAGCLVQRHRAQLLSEVPEIDALVGVFDRANIVAAVRGGLAPAAETGQDLGAFHAVSQFIRRPTKADAGQGYVESDRARLRLTPRHYAYLRISEGCNQGCTFCTIPSIRGRMRSKPLPAILAEAAELFADGAFELNLIGQDTTSYGNDIHYAPGLPGLLQELNKLADKGGGGGARGGARGGVRGGWLRLMYAYPSCFTDDMIKTLADAANFVKYIDMPLQHINDELLNAMRRKVTRKQTETLLDKLRKWVPGITLRTTLISGFPGETDANHAELLRFVEDFEFDCLGVFEFSPEPGTPAGRAHAEKGVPAKVAAERKEQIMLTQQAIAQRKNAALVGQTLAVLVDEPGPRKKTALARHAGQAPDIDGRVLVENTSAVPGELLQVQITAAEVYDLVAAPVETLYTPSKSKKVGLPVLR